MERNEEKTGKAAARLAFFSDRLEALIGTIRVCVSGRSILLHRFYLFVWFDSAAFVKQVRNEPIEYLNQIPSPKAAQEQRKRWELKAVKSRYRRLPSTSQHLRPPMVRRTEKPSKHLFRHKVCAMERYGEMGLGAEPAPFRDSRPLCAPCWRSSTLYTSPLALSCSLLPPRHDLVAVLIPQRPLRSGCTRLGKLRLCWLRLTPFSCFSLAFRCY